MDLHAVGEKSKRKIFIFGFKCELNGVSIDM